MERQIDSTNIDTELECISSDDANKLVLEQSLLNFAPFRHAVPPAIRFDLRN